MLVVHLIFITTHSLPEGMDLVQLELPMLEHLAFDFLMVRYSKILTCNKAIDFKIKFLSLQINVAFCLSDQRYKISINEWYNNVADSAGVLAHEIGHALGMYHDFGQTTSDIRYDSNGNRCTGLNGLMDYGSRSSVDKFTTCSKEDFTTWYRRVINTYGSFCLTCGKILLK